VKTNAVTPERGLKLYELTGEYEGIRRLIDAEAGAEFADDEARRAGLEAALAGLTEGIAHKSWGIAKIVLQQKAEADYIEAEAAIFEKEAARLKQRAEVKRAGTERLREYLATELASLGEDTQKFRSPTVTVTLSKASDDRVTVIDDSLIPLTFIDLELRRVPATFFSGVVLSELEKAGYIRHRVPAMTRINGAVQETGIVPPGCAVAPSKRTLRIY
jgi:hypothetical protein